MSFPGRPRRLEGFPYDRPGPVFHVRIGCLDRKPLFSNPRLAQAAVDALRFYGQSRINLFAYCIMPDHIHVLMALRQEQDSLGRWVADFKRWLGKFDVQFQPGFFEHVLRKEEKLAVVARYIVGNPIRAGLTAPGKTWPWAGIMGECEREDR
ncbi:MAG: transposase [Acidobacteriota bacterium]